MEFCHCGKVGTLLLQICLTLPLIKKADTPPLASGPQT